MDLTSRSAADAHYRRKIRSAHDLRSARDPHRRLHRAFDEQQVFRIDHYLGKDTVQNIPRHRFGNAIIEPLWNPCGWITCRSRWRRHGHRGPGRVL